MKKAFFLIAILFIFGKDILAQQETLTPFQTYSAALYLIRYQPVEMQDTVDFLLNKKWMEMTETYINALKKESDSSQYNAQKLNFPAIEKLGVIFEFRSKIHTKAWLETPLVKKIIQNLDIKIHYEPRSYYKPDSTIITLESNKYINWYVVMKWLQDNYELDIREYGYFYARIQDNDVWEKYEPHDCADKCSDYVWYMDYEDKNKIIWGHNSTSRSGEGWATDWTWNYNIKTQKFEKIIMEVSRW